jgi:hypothetical protein
MAYPYLTVNPCCTDVILNSPCGTTDPCSTHLTISSTIVYDGPLLPCIVAEPCDTLNVILQKIDEIICTLLSQINTLNNQVTNINSQLITINNDITNIYNVLDYCCVTTTTTSAPPCENFSLNNTGVDPVAIIITDCVTNVEEAIVLMPGDTNICVITNSPLVVPGTVIATPNGPCGTTTTTSTSSTTTTTTTAIPCECLTAFNGDSISHGISYTDCFGVFLENDIDITPYETIKFCGCCAYGDSRFVTISIGENCIDQLCPTTTTTTTICSNPNLIINSTFTSNLNGWNPGYLNGWEWSPAHGGSAHYIGRDQYDILSQDVLTLGNTYDITFDLWCGNPNVVIKALAGHAEYNTQVSSGYMQVHAILTCTDNTIFGIQAYDAAGEPFDTVFVDNVNVSIHCPQFTTTTTTCNPSTYHPYGNSVINSTNTIPDAHTLLANACSAAACRSIGSCTITSSTTLYYNVEYPPIGSLTYSSSNGCTLSGLTGYYPISFEGSANTIVAHIVNSVIVDYPSCT